MGADRNAEIRALIERLSNDIKTARSCSLNTTANLLQIAILDLKTILLSMSDDDIRYLTEALDPEACEGSANGHC
jgi:hypothetical protein